MATKEWNGRRHQLVDNAKAVRGAFAQVNKEQKEELILGKELRMATSKILQRPSEFHSKAKHQENISVQKQTSLPPASVEKWVGQIEAKFEAYHNQNISEPVTDQIDRQFEALRIAEGVVATDYATRKFDSLVPATTLLDTTPGRDKARVARQKSFRSTDNEGGQSYKKSGLATSRTAEKSQATNKARDRSVGSPIPDRDTPRNPHQNTTVKPSQLFKKLGNQESACFSLGMEPDVIPQQKHSIANQIIGKFTNSLERRKELMARTVEDEENLYEEIADVKKDRPPRKTKPRAPNPLEYEYSVVRKDSKKSLGMPELASPVSQALPDELHEEEYFKRRKSKDKKEPQAPFDRFQNCLFSTFTACTPWCCMKRVYWRKDNQSEEIFSVTVRRNSRVRSKHRNSSIVTKSV